MKITIIASVFPHPRLGIFPGIERYLQYLALNLKKQGINVQIITTFWNGGTKFDSYKGIPIFRVLDSKTLFGKIGSIARLNNYTIGFNFISKKIYKKFYDSNIVILAHPFGLTRYLKIKKVPTISIAYHYKKPELFQEYFELPFFQYIQKKQYKIHKNVVAISETTKTALISNYKLNEKDIKVIKIGIDFERFNTSNFSNEIKEKFGNNILLSVGPFLTRKRVPVLLKAMPLIIKNIPDVRLLLIGKGPLLNNYKKLSKSLGIQENVSFLGFIEDEELLKYYASSTLFIFTSELEGFGQVLLESMASGTPVVCANKLPMSEIVGHSGVTFKLNNSIDLADKIIDLLENKDKIIKLRKKALERVKTEYNWSQIIREFIEYIKSLKF